MSHEPHAPEQRHPQPAAPLPTIPIDLLPPTSLTRPLWKSLLLNLRDTIAREKLPPLELASRPANLGLPLGERLRMPWYRTVFSNLGEVVSPETLPPLELESVPVDVGELISDQISHPWFSSLLRNLADRVAPERLPRLDVESKPVADIMPGSWLLLPAWSEVITTPKVFYPDKPKAAAVSVSLPLPLPTPAAMANAARPLHPAEAGLLRDLRRSRIRGYIWMGMATAQAVYLIGFVVQSYLAGR
jgi:hypothetical protein